MARDLRRDVRAANRDSFALSIDRCRPDGFCLASAAVGVPHSQENGARLGGTGRPAEAFGRNLPAVGETGPVSERTVFLSASEATIVGAEPAREVRKLL